MAIANRRGRAAFTLIEVIAVVTLMGIALAVAVVSFRGTLRTARAQYAVESISQIDGQLREHAARFGRSAELAIDIDRGVITATTTNDDGHAVPHITHLESVAIDRVTVGNRRSGSGRIVVPFSVDGASPTYALRLHGESESRWLMFCGATGQQTGFDNDHELDVLLSEVFPQGADAY